MTTTQPLRECPFCGSDEIRMPQMHHYYQCQYCGSRGPADTDYRRAADLWNAAPRKSDVEALVKRCGDLVYYLRILLHANETENHIPPHMRATVDMLLNEVKP